MSAPVTASDGLGQVVADVVQRQQASGVMGYAVVLSSLAPTNKVIVVEVNGREVWRGTAVPGGV